MFHIFIVIQILKLVLSDEPSCVVHSNHCTKCHPLTKLCISCDSDIYSTDDKGWCQYARKCTPGNNYCVSCDGEGKLCKKCEEGYFPDGNGGCSYTNNCDISSEGECLICNDNYILIGQQFSLIKELKVCKSLNSDDLKNCKKINTIKGICQECEDGFYKNYGDSRCTKTQHCYESIFGACVKCSDYYYLDKREEKCLEQIGNFEHCKETLDGKTCNLCEENYYFDENGKCIWTNFCLEEGVLGVCKKCIDGYHISKKDEICTPEINCYSGNKDLGICTKCIDNYYIDFEDGKCKSNQDNEDFIYCVVADGVCKECIYNKYLGLDDKCSNSKYCSESVNGICIICKDGYYLGLDNYCTNVEHCIYSNYYQCEECEKDYYHDRSVNLCKEVNLNFTNCKYTNDGVNCSRCHNDYYLNLTDHMCYDNSEPGDFYKCQETDENATMCEVCINDYYLGKLDNKCTNIFGCELSSENNNRCLECNYLFCLNSKTGNCEDNEEINKEEEKIYYRCQKTNEEATACENCIQNYTLNANGLCEDEIHCEEKNEDGVCQKCYNDEIYSFCMNSQFGCIETLNDKCLECNDILDFNKCTKCFDGYQLDEKGNCVEM